MDSFTRLCARTPACMPLKAVKGGWVLLLLLLLAKLDDVFFLFKEFLLTSQYGGNDR